MKQSIAVHVSFYGDKWEQQISDGIRSLGYEPRILNGDVRLEDIEDCEVLFGMFPQALLRQCGRLRWLQCSFAGIDAYCGPGVFAREDVYMTNASGAYGVTIAEHLICVLLMMMRRMPEYSDLIAHRQWKILGEVRSIYDSVITVVGMGDIGSNFGKRVKAMGATVRGVRRTVGEKPDWADEVYPTERLNEALSGADAVVLCLPGTAETKNILSAPQFAVMKPGAYVLNVGRGTAIDQQALYDALCQKRLGGAALDVAVPEPLPQDHFLWDAPNLLLTPHIAGNLCLPKTCQLVSDIFLDNLNRWKNGLPLQHLVDRKIGY